MKTRKVFFYGLLFFIVFFANIYDATARGPIGDLGAVASDGTRMVLTYYDPDVQVLQDDSNNFKWGAERFISDGSYVQYNELHVYFLFSSSTHLSLAYNISYFAEAYNTTTHINDYYMIDSELRTVEVAGGFFIEDVVDMPTQFNQTLVSVAYKNAEIKFYHQTARHIIREEMSAMQITIMVLQHIGLASLMYFIFCIPVAKWLLKKAGGYFDIPAGAIANIFLILTWVFVIVTQYVYYISPKIIAFYIPIWSIYVAMGTFGTVIAIQKFNPERKFWRVDTKNNKDMRQRSIKIPIDDKESMFMEKGFVASCIRIINEEAYTNSIKFGHFDEIPSVETFDFKSEDKAQEKITEMKAKYPNCETKLIHDDVASKWKLTIGRKILEFKDSGITPKWQWDTTGNTGVIRSFDVKHIVTRKSSGNLKQKKIWLPAGLGLIVNGLISIFWKQDDKDIDLLVKILLWVVLILLIAALIGSQATNGEIQIEPTALHVAMSLVKASKHLDKAESDAKYITKLEDKTHDLETEMQSTSAKKGKNYAKKMIDGLLNLEEELKDHEFNKEDKS